MRFLCFGVVPLALVVPATAQGPTLYRQAKLTAADGESGDALGRAVDLDHGTALVGSPLDDDQGDHAGSAYVFVRDGHTWREQAKLLPDDGAAGDAFGTAVAVHGPLAVVGAPFQNGAGTYQGAAYVFVRSGTMWTQSAKLSAGNAADGDLFGSSVEFAGQWIVVGAPLADGASTDEGSVHVFAPSTSQTTEFAELRAPDADSGDAFGSTVATSGPVVAVGAPFDDGVGSVHVFRRQGYTFFHEQKLTPNDGAVGDAFGSSLAFDGETLVIGAFKKDSAATDAGAAYVYARNGSTWAFQQSLTASDGALRDFFGLSLAVDGERIAVAAVDEDTAGTDAGAVYTFRRNGTTWAQEDKVTAFDGASHDSFGTAVDLLGPRMLIGASGDDDASSDAGAAYVYLFAGGEPGVAYCFGSDVLAPCPCGNQPLESSRGCAHSAGIGMRISGSGSTSVSSDDLVLEASDCPPGNVGLFYVGTAAVPAGVVVSDGIQCVGGSVLRFPFDAQSTGTATGDHFVRRDPSGVFFQPATSYFFQYFSRDTSGGGTANCGNGGNLSPGYEVVMTP